MFVHRSKDRRGNRAAPRVFLAYHGSHQDPRRPALPRRPRGCRLPQPRHPSSCSGLPLLMAWLILDPADQRHHGGDLLHRSGKPALGHRHVSAALPNHRPDRSRGAAVLGLRAGRGRGMSLEQWTVGGRGFGARLRVPADGRRDLHDVHLPRRQRLCVREGRPAFYILGLRLTIAYVVPRTCCCRRSGAMRATTTSIRRPSSSRPGTTAPRLECWLAGRRRRHGSLPRAAVQGTGHILSETFVRRPPRSPWRGLAPPWSPSMWSCRVYMASRGPRSPRT